jgi:zinc D-Ala-D-Ala carboxypeptidase|tara:strand:- start:70 stop:396 length:327 start_codon:yes stop_codon:yes gene_type:complete
MSKYFKDKEENMDVDFLAKLDEAREYANIPFIINSAYRSPEHNAKVGGKPGSSHIKGLAVDISAKDSRTRFLILDALFAVGFTRIGIADSFIHVDSDIDKSQNVIWTY